MRAKGESWDGTSIEQIHIADVHIQVFVYFGLKGIGNMNQVLTNPLTVSALTNLAGGD